MDLTAGVNYKLEWNAQAMMVGYRLGHATRPRISFASATGSYRLDYSHTVYVISKIKLIEKIGIRPKALYYQTGSQNTWNAGLDLAVPIGKGITMFAGGGKMKNGLFLNGGMELGKWQWRPLQWLGVWSELQNLKICLKLVVTHLIYCGLVAVRMTKRRKNDT